LAAVAATVAATAHAASTALLLQWPEDALPEALADAVLVFFPIVKHLLSRFGISLPGLRGVMRMDRDRVGIRAEEPIKDMGRGSRNQ